MNVIDSLYPRTVDFDYFPMRLCQKDVYVGEYRCFDGLKQIIILSSRVGWFKPNGLNHWFKPWFKPLKKTMFFLVWLIFLVLMNLNALFSTNKATYMKTRFFNLVHLYYNHIPTCLEHGSVVQYMFNVFFKVKY